MKRIGFSITMLILIAIGFSCAHRPNGYHVSKVKEEELKAKSDFNLKQAKAIVNENAKNRPKNQKRAEKVRLQTNEAIEAQQAQLKTRPVRSAPKPKVVPSFY